MHAAVIRGRLWDHMVRTAAQWPGESRGSGCQRLAVTRGGAFLPIFEGVSYKVWFVYLRRSAALLTAIQPSRHTYPRGYGGVRRDSSSFSFEQNGLVALGAARIGEISCLRTFLNNAQSV